jgi:transposase
MNRIEVITSVERRRRWSAADKARLVAAMEEPGAIVTEVARKAGVDPSLLYRWRQELAPPCETARFVPMTVAPEEQNPVTDPEANAASPRLIEAVGRCPHEDVGGPSWKTCWTEGGSSWQAIEGSGAVSKHGCQFADAKAGQNPLHNVKPAAI